MEKNLIDYNIDNLNSNKIKKKIFLKNNGFDYDFVIEYSISDLKLLLDNNILFKNKSIYLIYFYHNSLKNNNLYLQNNNHNFAYVDSNNSLLSVFNNFRNIQTNKNMNNVYLYLEKINDNPLANIEDIYFLQLFVYFKIINSELVIYLYNHYYYITLNFNSNKYIINYINGYFSFFTKENLNKMINQCKNIILQIIDIYAKYVENDEESIDIWKFIFSIDKYYNINLYDYNRFNKNIYIYTSNSLYNQYINNDLLTNLNNYKTKQDNNFIILKKYNLV